MLFGVFDTLILPECLDDSPQDEEGCVDVSSLLLTVARVMGLFDPLRAGQIAE